MPYIYYSCINQNGLELLYLENGTREVKKDIPEILNLDRQGKITKHSIRGASEDYLMGLSVLHDLIVDEEIYISIYTKNFPNNEIREDSWSKLTVIFQVRLIVLL